MMTTMTTSTKKSRTTKTRTIKEERVAEKTWRRGILHLTVDGSGLVSLWDHPVNVISYVEFPLTSEQQKLIEEVMRRGGPTP